MSHAARRYLIARMALAWILGWLCAACRPAPPPLPSPPGLPEPLLPGRGLAVLRPLPARPPALECTGEVRLAAAMPDPVRVPDREGEWLEIHTDAPVPLSLDGWALEAGRSRLVLEGAVVSPGEALCIGGPSAEVAKGRLRLRNSDGAVSLVDPCGVTRSTLTWDRARPGGVVRASPPWAGRAAGPARRLPGGTSGGCGQT